MRNSYTYILGLLSFFLISCGGGQIDEVLIDGASIQSFQSLEEKLSSEKLSSNSKGVLPWKFLPVDSHFVMTNPIKYKRTSYASLPMTSRAYSDSLNNEVLIYEWDLIEQGMSEEEKDKLKHGFEDQHEVYVSKYNELIDRVTYVLGAPKFADKELQWNNSEVYKSYSGKNIWESDRQVIEVSYYLLPTEVYRVTLKNFIFATKDKVVQ